MPATTLPDSNEVAGGRVFIALWPPPVVAAQMTQAAAALIAESCGRPLDAADLHLTLAFLGALAPDRCAAAARALERTPRSPVFELSLDRVGCFARAGVLWLGTWELPAALLDLHGALWTELAAAGFAPEHRRFEAHVTLARKSARVRARRLAPPIRWQADTLVLATSSPDAAAPPRYRRLAAVSLEA